MVNNGDLPIKNGAVDIWPFWPWKRSQQSQSGEIKTSCDLSAVAPVSGQGDYKADHKARQMKRLIHQSKLDFPFQIIKLNTSFNTI